MFSPCRWISLLSNVCSNMDGTESSFFLEMIGKRMSSSDVSVSMVSSIDGEIVVVCVMLLLSKRDGVQTNLP